MKKKISVIIPVYNSEKNIKKTVNSILNQTYQNIEIILVDDGSTDNSYAICKKYSKKYNNIKVYTKKNEGPGPARNLGIRHANGEYIGFVDSDDFIHKKMYEDMMCAAIKDEIDIVQCGFKKVNEEGIELYTVNLVEKREIIEGNYNTSLEYARWSKINSFLCNKIFKKELFDKIELPSLFYGEDQVALVKLFNKSQRVLLIPEPYLYYVQNEDSLFHQDFNLKQLDSITSGKMMYEYHENNFKDLMPYYSARVIQYIIKFYYPVKTSNYKNKKKILKTMKKDYKKHSQVLNKKNILTNIPKRRRILLKLSRVNLFLVSALYNIYQQMILKKGLRIGR